MQLYSSPNVESCPLTDISTMNVAESTKAETMFVILLNIAIDIDKFAKNGHLKNLTDLQIIQDWLIPILSALQGSFKI
jgi:hypothetical protein